MSSDHAAATATKAKKDRRMVSWTQEEDDLLRNQVAVHGSDNWTIIAAQFKDKTGRQCRRRWLTYLNTECKKGGWSEEEDILLCQAQKIFGNRWTEIAKVVTGRTDNAVKNRFSTLCKKRAKDHIISKENNDSCVHPKPNKKIMLEPSANKQHIRYGGLNHEEDVSSYERVATTRGISGAHSRPPLAVLTQNFNNLSCFPVQLHLDYSIKPTESDMAIEAIADCEAQGDFLRRDDPKLTALLQQAELLSSLAVKAYTENKSQSLGDAWQELQNYLIRNREDGTSSTFSEMDFLLDNFDGELKDFQCMDTEIQLSRRDADVEDSQNSSERSIECAYNDPGNNIDKHQFEHCSMDRNEWQSHQHEGTPAPGGAMSYSLQLAQNGENLLVSSKSDFDSPLKTIPPFHSFTEIPSPEFSCSERKFLLSVLGMTSPKPASNINQTPSKRDPRPNAKQSHSCKRVLLNSL